MNELATVAVVLLLTIAALLALAPAISLALVRSRGRGLPPSLATRLNEEWSGELEAIPDAATKLAFAIGIRFTRRKAFAGLEGDAMTAPEMTPRRPFISLVGGWKTVVVAPVVLLAIVGYAASYFITPLYSATATVLVVPQRVPDEVVKPQSLGLEDRLQSMTQQILSRTRLERIIQDFNLYPDERQTGLMEDVVARMRKDVALEMVRGDTFRVSYVGTDPRITMRVTERLASLFIEENLRDREVLAVGTSQFLDAQIVDTRKRLIELGKTLAELQAAGNDTRPETVVMKLEYDTVSALFKDLLTKREAATVAANLERRQIGEQFRLLDPAGLPERPFVPKRLFMMLVGAVVGLCVGVAMMLSGLGRPPRRPPEAVTVGNTSAVQN